LSDPVGFPVNYLQGRVRIFLIEHCIISIQPQSPAQRHQTEHYLASQNKIPKPRAKHVNIICRWLKVESDKQCIPPESRHTALEKENVSLSPLNHKSYN